MAKLLGGTPFQGLDVNRTILLKIDGHWPLVELQMSSKITLLGTAVMEQLQ